MYAISVFFLTYYTIFLPPPPPPPPPPPRFRPPSAWPSAVSAVGPSLSLSAHCGMEEWRTVTVDCVWFPPLPLPWEPAWVREEEEEEEEEGAIVTEYRIVEVDYDERVL